MAMLETLLDLPAGSLSKEDWMVVLDFSAGSATIFRFCFVALGILTMWTVEFKIPREGRNQTIREGVEECLKGLESVNNETDKPMRKI